MDSSDFPFSTVSKMRGCFLNQKEKSCHLKRRRGACWVAVPGSLWRCRAVAPGRAASSSDQPWTRLWTAAASAEKGRHGSVPEGSGPGRAPSKRLLQPRRSRRSHLGEAPFLREGQTWLGPADRGTRRAEAACFSTPPPRTRSRAAAALSCPTRQEFQEEGEALSFALLGLWPCSPPSPQGLCCRPAGASQTRGTPVVLCL